MSDWDEEQPIFRQLARRITDQILQGTWSEGQSLPSVRLVASDLKINHLTVMKGYQLLVDEGLVEKRRGQGMFVAEGAFEQLLMSQKRCFIETDIPAIATKLQRLNISISEFIERIEQHLEENI